MLFFVFTELLGYDDEQKSQVILDNFNTPSAPPKRQKQSLSGTDADWKLLTADAYCRVVNMELRNTLNLRTDMTTSVDDAETPVSARINTNSILFPYIRIIHFTLHLLYEELKLNTLRSKELPYLAQFLSHLANSLSLKYYSVYYWKDFTEHCSRKCREINKLDLKNVTYWSVMSEQPYSIMQHMYDTLRGINISPYPFIPNVNPRSKDIVQVILLFLSFWA